MKCSTIPRLYTLLGTGCQCTLHSMSLPYRYVFLKPDLQCSVILRFRPPIPKASTSYTCDKNCRPFLQHCMWLAAIHSKLAAIAHQCPCIMPPSFESQEPKEDSKKTSQEKFSRTVSQLARVLPLPVSSSPAKPSMSSARLVIVLPPMQTVPS